jgi:HAD superfamily phosphoserine phosphatase-like hydrolase
MKRKIAFFDVDKTIYKGYSANDFINYIDSNSIFDKKPLNKLQELENKYKEGRLNYHDTSQQVMNLLANIVEGRTPEQVDETVKAMLENVGMFYNEFFPDVHKVLKKNDFEIILISGGADFIIRNIAEQLGVKYFATVYEHKNGVYVAQQPTSLNGELKANVVRDILDDNTYSISFGDSEGDYPMFELTDNAFLYTNSGEKKKEAIERGWIILNDENALEEVVKELVIETEPINLS